MLTSVLFCFELFPHFLFDQAELLYAQTELQYTQTELSQISKFKTNI